MGSTVDGTANDGQPFLFFRDSKNGKPSRRVKCLFRLIPVKKGGDLEEFIWANGGDVLKYSTGADHAITILDEQYYMKNHQANNFLPYDTYSSMFIYHFVESWTKGRDLPDLNQYRITESKYETYDANKVMLGKAKWPDLVPRIEMEFKTMSESTAQDRVSELKDAIGTVKGDDKRVRDMPHGSPSKQDHKNLRQNHLPLSSSSPEVQMPNGTSSDSTPSSREVQIPNGTSSKSTPSKSTVAQSPTRTITASPGNNVPPTQPPSLKAPESKSPQPQSPNKRVSISSPNHSTPAKQTKKIFISPHPNTSATIIRPHIKLVNKAVAGPSGNSGSRNSGPKLRQANIFTSPKSTLNSRTDAGKQSRTESSDDISYHSDSDDDQRSIVSARTQKSGQSSYSNRRGAPFTLKEGQLILELICEHDAYKYTGGTKLWKHMEESERFPGRTYQSLKEHFRKKVLPNALEGMIYKITPECLKRLKKAQDRANWTKHANVCPDYTF